MGNRRTVLGSNGKVGLSGSGNMSGNKGKRWSKSDGSIVHVGIKRNHTEMGEIAKAMVNTLGWMTLIAGVLANLDNALSILLGVVALAFGVVKFLDGRESWLIKRVDRMEREDKYKNKNKLP